MFWVRFFVCFLFIGGNSVAQEFPSAPVKLVVPAAPGGGFDLFGRILGKKLAERWKHQLVIENRAGGGGNIAAAHVVRSKPDGYTLFVWNDTMLINPSLMANVPYDPQKDFTPISLALYVPNILVAHPATGPKTMAELVDREKALPGSLSYGSPGPGSPAHLGAELLNQLAGTQLRHVPYKGAGPAISDVVGGHISLAMVAVPGAMEHLRAGRLVPLAVTSRQRVQALPEVPTMREAGVRGYRMDTFFAILGPAGMAAELVERLQQDLHWAITDSDVSQQLVRQGFQPVGASAAELRALIARDQPLWRDLVRKSGAKSE